MPLLAIVAQSCGGTTLPVASVFMPSETEEDYVWALEQLRRYLGDFCPNVIVTDRELALMSAIRTVFPGAANLLCVWHINKNVLHHVKKLFKNAPGHGGSDDEAAPVASSAAGSSSAPTRRGATTGGTYEKNDEEKTPATEFMEAWRAVVHSATPCEYEDNLRALDALANERERATRAITKARMYVKDVWLNDHATRFVAAFANRSRHFGMLSTSMVEGFHSAFKRRLKTSTGDFLLVLRALQLTYTYLEREFSLLQDQDYKLVMLTSGTGVVINSVRRATRFPPLTLLPAAPVRLAARFENDPGEGRPGHGGDDTARAR